MIGYRIPLTNQTAHTHERNQTKRNHFPVGLGFTPPNSDGKTDVSLLFSDLLKYFYVTWEMPALKYGKRGCEISTSLF